MKLVVFQWGYKYGTQDSSIMVKGCRSQDFRVSKNLPIAFVLLIQDCLKDRKLSCVETEVNINKVNLQLYKVLLMFLYGKNEQDLNPALDELTHRHSNCSVI